MVWMDVELGCRAPDSYVYPAPFSLIELILVTPFEYDALFSRFLSLIAV